MPIEIGDYVTLELAEGGFIGGRLLRFALCKKTL